ncbi:uncharacterized protein K460DRAFT_363336 [Cucurbitaria berberidis CBS 394.84]|uniref:REJ domain-containing protein n=1 Tax=Cucurbitaria berberidis CBS 394.84 TaxID=1168544 RepID=A0A9P4GL44_9PLEO|nr:uncharacterized protein K460DRAFT_363336 [Cucurbitaria berberidis CBS 394.84]KAF1847227.1 hypothetical protein K460DRAFT_363336 [Cucurbitaria berberidis CBS 394.84]
MVRTIFAVFWLVAAVYAQSSNFNGPLFDPSKAPFFGPSSLVFPTLTDAVPTFTQTPTSIRSRISSGASGSLSTQTRNSTSTYNSSSHSSSAFTSSSTSASRTSSSSQSATRSSSSTASASATGAAVVNYPGVVGAIAGGLFAGLALV